MKYFVLFVSKYRNNCSYEWTDVEYITAIKHKSCLPNGQDMMVAVVAVSGWIILVVVIELSKRDKVVLDTVRYELKQTGLVFAIKSNLLLCNGILMSFNKKSLLFLSYLHMDEINTWGQGLGSSLPHGSWSTITFPMCIWLQRQQPTNWCIIKIYGSF